MKSKNDPTLVFRVQGDNALSDPAQAEDLLRKFFYYNLFYACFRNSHYTDIHYFPAERTAINVFPDTSHNPEPKPYLNAGHGIIGERYPDPIVPVKKYTELVGRLLGKVEIDRNRGQSKFSEPAGLLETRILNSKIQRDSIAKKIYMEKVFHDARIRRAETNGKTNKKKSEFDEFLRKEISMERKRHILKGST